MQHAHQTAPAFAAAKAVVSSRSTPVSAPRELDLQTLKLVSGGATSTRTSLAGAGPRGSW